MPPQRTTPPTKAVKTERTHEENQERAYIAASRRSDRSLEARIESARRASEIHKKRTGRALRVTEQDVVNEEMYSEEDDEYPTAYRGLTQHLRSGSSDWNRRLNAYLTQHVAMRSALDQALMNSYSRGPYSQNTMYTSGFLPQQHPQMIQQPQLIPHQQLTQQTPMIHSPHMVHSQNGPPPQVQTSHVSLRQQPYPSPNNGHRHHGRPMQMHLPHLQQGIQMPQYQQESTAIRRSSIAVPTVPSPLSQASAQPNTRQMSSPPANPPQVNPTQLTSPQVTPQQPQDRVLQPTFEQTASSNTPQTSYLPQNDSYLFEFPLTTQLPPETQQFLQPVLDPNDSMYPALMGNYSTSSFGFDSGTEGLKSVSPDTTSPTFSLFDFSELCGAPINQFPLCGSPGFESQYCSPDPTAQQMMSSPLKSSPVSPLSPEENLGLVDGTWYQYLNTDDVTKAS